MAGGGRSNSPRVEEFVVEGEASKQASKPRTVRPDPSNSLGRESKPFRLWIAKEDSRPGLFPIRRRWTVEPDIQAVRRIVFRVVAHEGVVEVVTRFRANYLGIG